MAVFEAEARTIKDAEFLGQGTLYPDVIESISAFGGPSAVIKSHHNVGGLPKTMKLKLVEPLRYLGATAAIIGVHLADRIEERTGRRSLISRLIAPLTGH
jgi:hypothetical protein